MAMDPAVQKASVFSTHSPAQISNEFPATFGFTSSP